MAGFMTHLILLPLLLGSMKHTSIQANRAHPGFRFYNESKSWIDALQHCRNNNSFLVEIRNKTVQGEVNKFLNECKENIGPGVWIGLERSIFGHNPSWVWSSNRSKVDSFHMWNGSHPVDQHNNHCGKLILHIEEVKWLDANCREPLPFICQIPGPKNICSREAGGSQVTQGHQSCST